MTIGETVRKAIKELSEGLLGLMMPKDIRLTDDEDKGLYVGLKREEKPKRARNPKGTYRADDKKTKDVNEAWVGGKAPKKKAKRKTKGKK
jgi:hypothetical protein